ncbi:MAG: aminoglycoside 6-adenylyltransferase [Defluviitaleaceae bacterium]|nr:aminoglycoside 6-adenylyltransferase [Defluviitaleaceae bacterium]
MRTEQEMMELILRVANADERIRAVSMEGSRANPAVQKDKFQDYDISYYVTDVAPYFNNPEWIFANFGKPLIMQMPENLREADNDGDFCYLIIFPDGNRIDLGIKAEAYIDDGEPSITLLDKDNGNGFRPEMPLHDDKFWHIKPPTLLDWVSCTNNFWWCLGTVRKCMNNLPPHFPVAIMMKFGQQSILCATCFMWRQRWWHLIFPLNIAKMKKTAYANICGW